MEKITKDAFCVIGKVGSTNDGEGFIKKLWEAANSHFDEIASLAVYRENGSLAGLWGAMTDFGFSFSPWEDNFSKGFYLAGVEAKTDAIAPKGWKKWIIPGFEYLKVEVNSPDVFTDTIAYMKENAIPLVGAVQDFTDPETGKAYMLFPIKSNDSKAELMKAEKNKISPFAVCGLNCDFCFLTEWCGGCRSACNVCSYATMSEDNICPNVKCAQSKKIEGCLECDEIKLCKKGFYSPESDGANASKALAIFTKNYGKSK